jgi:hypothetical protein
MSINWRERFIAAGIHFLVTLGVAALAAALIFGVWFPGEMATMVRGTDLFWLVLGIDVILGPLISLIIYNSKKTRRHLVMDYSVVALVQLAALIYGVSIVALSRPVFVAFYGDRLEIVTAIELEDADLAQAIRPEFKTRSWTGPKLVAMHEPTDLKEKQAILFSALEGKDGHLMPKYYRDYQSARAAILKKAQPLAILLTDSGAARERLENAIKKTGRASNDLRWLLVHHRFGFAVAYIDTQTAKPLSYLDIDPVWLDKPAPVK